MPWLEPITLRGAHARLEPLSHDHADGLIEAVKDGELWKLWYTFIPRPEDMRKEIEHIRPDLETAGQNVDEIIQKFVGTTTPPPNQ